MDSPGLRLRHFPLLPLAWAPVTLASFYCGWHGDEYLMWLLASLPGWWVMLVKSNSGDIHDFWTAMGPFLLAGLATMSLAGLLLDWLGAMLRWWVGTILIASPILWLLFLSRHPTLTDAVAKHDSLMAPAMASLGIAMCVGIGVAALAGVAARKWSVRTSDAANPKA